MPGRHLRAGALDKLTPATNGGRLAKHAAGPRTPLRAWEGNDLLSAAVGEAISRKPKGYDLVIDRHHNEPAVSRHMSVTGG